MHSSKTKSTNNFDRNEKHDAQLDYYGKRLATCSSDRTIKIFDVVDGEAQKHTGGQTLTGYAMFSLNMNSVRVIYEVALSYNVSRHSGPVWQVAWAHPKFGHILASCSYDGRVLIWREQTSQQASAPASWARVKEHTLHTASGIFEHFISERHVTDTWAVLKSTRCRGHPMNLAPWLRVHPQMENYPFLLSRVSCCFHMLSPRSTN